MCAPVESTRRIRVSLCYELLQLLPEQKLHGLLLFFMCHQMSELGGIIVRSAGGQGGGGKGSLRRGGQLATQELGHQVRKVGAHEAL